MTISTKQADRLIATGETVRMIDVGGDSGLVRFVARDRRSVEYVSVTTGRAGKIERTSIGSVARP